MRAYYLSQVNYYPCNAHDDLLAALKGMLDQPETPDAYDASIARAQAAIAKAEGRA